MRLRVVRRCVLALPVLGLPVARGDDPCLRQGLALGELEPDQGGGARAAGGLDGAGALVGEAGQDAGGLLVGAERGAAGGLDGPPGDQVVDEPRGALGRLVVEELPVHHHDGCEVAGRVALDVFEGDLAVVGRLVVADAEVLLERVEDGVAAHDRAQGVGADPYLVITTGLTPVHGVEGRDGRDLGGGEVEGLGAEGHPRTGDVPLLGLDEVEQRQQGGAASRVAGDHLLRVRVEPGAHVGRVGGGGELRHPQTDLLVCGHRSTPPITGSMDATATITSATWPPSHIAAMACRLVKDGSRKWTR